MNPTQERFMNEPNLVATPMTEERKQELKKAWDNCKLNRVVVLPEPIDITHEVVESEWAENWKNYQPVAIVNPPKDSSFDLGFREACIRMRELIPPHMIGIRWELEKMYNEKL